MGLLRGSKPTLPPRPTGFSRRPLSAWSLGVLCRLGLGVLGRWRYDRKPWRPWIMWLGGLHGRIDDCGMWKLTLSVALSDPLLNFPEDVGHVEGQMVRRGAATTVTFAQRCGNFRSRMASASSGRTSPGPVRCSLFEAHQARHRGRVAALSPSVQRGATDGAARLHDWWTGDLRLRTGRAGPGLRRRSAAVRGRACTSSRRSAPPPAA